MKLLKFTLIFALYNVIFTIPLLKNLANFDVGITYMLATIFCEFLIFSTLYSLLFWKRIQTNIFVYFFLIMNAFVFYFMSHFNTPINYDIFTNALQTNIEEVKDFLNFDMFFIVIIFGFVPCCAYYDFTKKVDIFDDDIKHLLMVKGIVVIVSIILILIMIFDNFKNFLVIRQNNELFDYLPPYNYIVGTIKTIKKSKKSKKKITTRIEKSQDDDEAMAVMDGKLKNISNGSAINLKTKNRNLIVYIVGESERSKSISYNGYDKNTMKFLDKYRDNIVNFQNFYSCNTSTFNSIPCMFTHSQKLDLDSMLEYENYVDIFKKLNFGLQWKTNNGGCKGVCGAITDVGKVDGGDIELLGDLNKEISKLKADNNVIYLHFRGSHGTEYYKRYPDEFEYWKPACKEKELRKCDDESIINAYDNSIRYTMFIVAKLIEILKANNDFNTGLVFVSDHGENIGENGFYLHGTPYILTKEVAGKVASFMWFNDNLLEEFKLNKQCMKNKESGKFGHFNMFHTMLGLFRVNNAYYDEKMDIFKSCQLTQ
ncbi:MAG: sulfatase-like hydrolase/transferase [Rickettsiales bacterium]|jgi:lipid A ethanolaminephosphotransferase|nr:sulfatase-like hydrolase/transferase [Rickettsiales bacterium]